MRFWLPLFCFCFFLPAALAAPADKDALYLGQPVVELATDHIDIHVGFHGQLLKLCGTKENYDDVAIVIRGPARDMQVTKKQRVLGAWVNGETEMFKQIPSFYRMASNFPLSGVNEEDLKFHQIGLNALTGQSLAKQDERRGSFYHSLVRNRMAQGLLPAVTQKLNFLSDRFFCSEFFLPSNVPIGQYRAEGYFFMGGEVRSILYQDFVVARAGFSAGLKDFSSHYPFLYGVLCVALAIFAGWLSNRLKRAF